VTVPKRYGRIWAKQLSAWLAELLTYDAGQPPQRNAAGIHNLMAWTVTPTKLWPEWSQCELAGRERVERYRRELHGTVPAGTTPAPPYYHPDEAEPDQADQAETNARGVALVTAALQQRVEPDWDDLPIPIPTLPTDYEKATRDPEGVAASQTGAA
jgi:hypothetical protein